MTSVADAEVIKHLSILIADGRSHSRALLRSMLSKLEVKKVHEVSESGAALDAIVTINPDVVIVDWELPAWRVLRVAQSSRAHSDLPIIVLSSSGRSAHVHNAMRLGAPHFMVWPISVKMLEQRLVGVVAKARKTALAYKNFNQPQNSRPGEA